ncbi:MAG: glycoside hydrolase family 88 protein [Myxococcales bacterium]|nr:glycoside hydrolase family 88 protein [Myxococcales bacterium]
MPSAAALAYHPKMRCLLLALCLPLAFGCDDDSNAAADAAPSPDAAIDAAPPLDAAVDAAPDPADEPLARAAARLGAAAAALDPADGLPKWVDGTTWTTSDAGTWTSGFFSGALWLLYTWRGDETLRMQAERWMAPVELQSFNRFNHDVGFKILPTYGRAWQLTGDEHARQVLRDGAASLASRFDPDVGCTRSWNNPVWRFPVIIDNLMNLEILFAAAEDGDDEWRAIAESHGEKTLANHVRPDGSTFHVVDYDPDTGDVISQGTHQGLADDTTWARGQTWAIYGFTMLFRETGREDFHEGATRTADWFVDHLDPADPVPHWDFSAPAGDPHDASSAAIGASALIELADYVDPPDDARYRAAADMLLAALDAPPYTTEGTEIPATLQQSVGNLPTGNEISVPLIYADYYFIEAQLRARAAR